MRKPNEVGLEIGASGAEVRALHEVLARHELVALGAPEPSEESAARYETRAVVTEPEEFTDVTAGALRRLQARLGVAVTGVWDRATAAAEGDCCAESAVDVGGGLLFGDPVMTYRLFNLPSGLPAEEVFPAVSQAFAMWGLVTRLAFRHVHGDGADIEISFKPLSDGVWGNALIELNDDLTWRIRTRENAGDPPFDFITILAHEIGHKIGVDHVPDATALMATCLGSTSRFRTLTSSDIPPAQALWGVPEVATVSSIHGHTAAVEHPDRLLGHRAEGAAGVFLGRFQPTWLHIAPPTPLWSDRHGVRLHAVRLHVRTYGGGIVRDVEVWDGDRRLEKHLVDVRGFGVGQPREHRIVVGVAAKPTVRDAVGISIRVDFDAGYTDADRRVDIISAACEYLVPRQLRDVVVDPT